MMELYDAVKKVEENENVYSGKTDLSPDEYAKNLNTSQATGLPLETVQRNPKEAESLLPKDFEKSDEWSNIWETASGGAEWVKANGPLISDDFSLPARLGRLMGTIGQKAKNVGGAAIGGVASFNEGIYGTLQTQSAFIDQNSPDGVYAFFKRQHDASAAYADMFFPKQDEIDNKIEGQAYDAVRSVTNSIPSIVLSVLSKRTLPGLALAGIGAFGTTGAKDLNEGKDKGTAVLHAVPDAGWEIAGELFGFRKLIFDTKVGTPLFKKIMNQFITDVPGEVATGEGQAFDEWAINNQDKPFSEFLDAMPSRAADTAVVSMLASGIQTGVIHSITRGPRVKVEPEQLVEDVKKVSDVVRNHKLWQRSPTAGRDLLNRLSADETIYVNAKALADEINSATPEQAAILNTAIPELRNEIETALSSTGFVSLKRGDFFHYFSSVNENLAQHTKLDPEDLTLFEKQEAAAEAAQAPDISEIKIDPPLPDNSNEEKAISRTIIKALSDAGITTEASPNAKNIAKVYAKMSAALGLSATDVFNKGLHTFQQVDESGNVIAEGSNFSVLLNDLETLNKTGSIPGADENAVNAVKAFGERLAKAELTPGAAKKMSSKELLNRVYPQDQAPSVQIGDATLTIPNVQVGQTPDGGVTVNIAPQQDTSEFDTLNQRYKEPKAMPKAPAAMNDSEAFSPIDPSILKQSAYHGSPYRFERFDLSKIGTGEGAQAYGWGQYFAENKNVAESYRNNLSNDVAGPAKRALTRAGGDIDSAVADAQKEIVRLEGLDLTPETGSVLRDAKIKGRKGIIDELINFKNTGEWRKGQLYQVHIPDEDVARMLDWDKPSTEQFGVNDWFIELPTKARKSISLDIHSFGADKVTGQIIYGRLADALGSQRAASEWFVRHGVPGIKYFDGLSRADGEGSRNYVVFDQKLLDKISDSIETFYQKERGSIQFNQVPAKEFEARLRSITISFTKNKNFSTLSHEFCHEIVALHRMFAEMARERIAAGDTNPEVRRIADDWEKLKEFVETDSDIFTAEQEEKIARTYEAYLLDGRAPSKATQSIFKRFRDWMVSIYKDINGISREAGFKVVLDDNIRGVFDRWIASEDEIAAVSDRNDTLLEIARTLGLKGDIQSDVDKAIESVTASAEDELYRKLSREKKKRESAGYKEELSKIKKDVEREFSEKRAYRTVKFLKEKGVRIYVGPDTNAILGEPPQVDTFGDGQLLTHDDIEEIHRAIDEAQSSNETRASIIQALLAPKPKRPRTLIEFLRSKGGVKDIGGNLKAMNPPAGLINNKSGLSPDYAREAAVEAGYIKDAGAESDTIQAQSTTDDLFRLINKETAKENVYSEHDMDEVMAYNDRLALEDMADQIGISQKDIEKARAEQRRYGNYSHLFTTETTTEGATDADYIAELFGYKSGIEMIREVRKLPLLSNVVSREANSRMNKKYGSFIDKGKLRNEAFHAIYNSDDTLVAIDILIRELGKTQGRNAKGMRLYAATIADRQVSGMLASQSGYAFRYDTAYQKETRLALKESRAGNIDEAIRHLQKAMVCQAIYKRLTKFNDLREKAFELFDKVNGKDKVLADKSDIDFLGAARFLLHKFDLGGENFSASQWLEDLQKLDPDTRSDIEFAATIMSDKVQRKPYADMTIEEFRNLHNAVLNIYETARNLKKHDVLGEQYNSEQIAAEIIAAMDKPKPLSGKTQMNALESANFALGSYTESSWRMEQWAFVSDGDFHGPTSRYIVDAVMPEIAKYNARRTIELGKLADVLKKHEEFLRERPGKIVSPWMRVSDDETVPMEFSDNQELIGFLLHVGNPSNLDKLTGGYGINKETFWQKMNQMEKDGVITKKHWSLVKDIAAIVGGLKEEAYLAHKKIHGFRPDSIEPHVIPSIHGPIIGYYYPAIADPNQSANVNRIEQEQQSSSKYANANVFQGMFKSRVQGFREPLSTDLRLASNHIDQMLRFIYIQPVARSVSRIINRNDYRQAVMRRNPHAFKEIIKPWIERCVRQSTDPVYNDSGDIHTHIRNFQREFIKRTNDQIMKYNAPIGVQNLSNLIPAIQKLGLRNFQRAFIGFVANPPAFIDSIKAASPFVAKRLETHDEKILNTIDEIINRRDSFHKVRNDVLLHGGIFIRMFDRMIVPITWKAAYNQHMDKTKDEKASIIWADKMVRATNGDTSPESISNFEASAPMTKMLTPFMGWFNSFLNFVRSEMAVDYRKNHKWGRVIGIGLALTLPASIIGQLIVDVMRGNLPDDEDHDGSVLDDWIIYLLGGYIRFLGNLAPGGGVVVGTVSATLNENPTDDRLSLPVINAANTAIRTVAEAKKEFESGRVRDSKMIKDALNSIGIATGLPLGQVSKPISYAVDVKQGRTSPDGPLNYMQGLVAGPPPKK